MQRISVCLSIIKSGAHFLGRRGAPILFSLLGIRMASCSWTMYVCMYVYFGQFKMAALEVSALQVSQSSVFAFRLSNEIRT